MAKREDILQAAIEVLAKQGFEDTKIRDIAKAANVADGTIYLYFKNKDELLVELFECVMKRALKIFRKAVDACDDPEQKLRCFIHTHLHLVQEEPEMAQIISVVLRQSTAFIKEYKNRLFSDYLTILQEILSAGVAAGLFKANYDSLLISRALFGAVDEIALAWLLSRRRDQIPLEESSSTLSALILNGIAAPSTK
jgi:TetR/AcrR family fatty acid metabolism transcriptional regulator